MNDLKRQLTLANPHLPPANRRLCHRRGSTPRRPQMGTNLSDLPVEPAPRRRGKGRPFEKGNTIGRHGRRKRDPTVTQLCRDASPEAVETLIKIMRDERAPHGVRAHCADKIIERAWGKAPAHNTVDIQHNVRAADLSDDQLLRIIAGETLQSVLAAPSRSAVAPSLGVSRGLLLEAQAVEVEH